MKKIKVGKKMFTQNELGEYWQAYCVICTGDVFGYKLNDINFIFEDGNFYGRPICKGCYNDLKDKIPEKINLIKKNEIERVKNFTAENIFANIKKTHQPKIEKIKNNLEKWL